MNIQEIISSGLVESYVLGVCTPEEATMMECMAKSFPELRQAIQDCQETIETLNSKLAQEPPQALKDKIWARLESENATSEAVTDNATFEKTAPEAKIIPIKSRTGLAIAASLLFIASAGINFYQHSQDNAKELAIQKLKDDLRQNELSLNKSAKQLALLRNPKLSVIKLKGVEQHTGDLAVVYWENESGKVYLDASALPAAPEGMQYQLWAIVDGKPVNAGLYVNDEALSQSIATIHSANAFAITLEKTGGSETPTLSNLQVLGNI